MIEKYGLKKEEWHFYGQWEQPPLSADFWLRSHGEYWDKLKLPKVDRGILEIGGYYFVFQ